jgi:fumarate hydratase class II
LSVFTGNALADTSSQHHPLPGKPARRDREGSPAIATTLNRYLGYEEVAATVNAALAERRSIREIVIARGHIDAGHLTEAQLDEALNVLSMTRPEASR